MQWLVYGFLFVSQISKSVLEESPREGQRLPDTVVPTHYLLEIITELDPTFIFQGQVTIKLECRKPTNIVTLHSRNLDVAQSQASLQEVSSAEQGSGKNITIEEIKSIKPDLLDIKLKEELSPNKTYALRLGYSGRLSEDLVGFYRSQYYDNQENNTRWMAVTQFEPTNARRAFPCFDEPAMKARFLLKLGHKLEFTALGNMPLKKKTEMEGRSGWVWSEFEESVPMSTYLFAMVVGDLARSNSVIGPNNVEFKIWARKDALNQTAFAKNVGPEVLEYFERYFDIKFPLPKMDMVAIPDFSYGAMENWGLITYRETALLWDPEISSKFDKNKVTSTIAHEIAHQWFGNLVTMKWWSDIWLNEGFATYVATLGTNHVFPEWGIKIKDGFYGTKRVFEFDSYESSHPVRVTDVQSDKIEQIFDAISYEKGAALIRMMNEILGEETFRMGVSKYLKKFKYSNARQEDLWECLTEQAYKDGALPSGMSVQEIMDTWTLQTGYPYINVRRNYEKGSAVVSQTRFLFDNAGKYPHGNSSSCWFVPLSYTNQPTANFTDIKPKVWLSCANKSTEIEKIGSDQQWVIFNIGLSSLYRVNYDERNWKLIEQALKSDAYTTIQPINRAQILIDSMAMAAYGELDYSIPLSLLQYLKQEYKYIPWAGASGIMHAISTFLHRSPGYIYWKRFVRSIVEPVYENVKGIQTEDISGVEATRFKNLILTLACSVDAGKCRQESVQLFEQWKKELNPDVSNPIPKDFRKIVYCTALEELGYEAWDFLWERYTKSNNAHEKSRILVTLGCSKDVWVLNRYLEMTINKTSGIRSQDGYSIVSTIGVSPIGFYLVKDFIFNKFNQIRDYYGHENSRVGAIIKGHASQITSKSERDELNSFIEKNKHFMKHYSQNVDLSVATAARNVEWTERYYDKFIAALKNIENQKG